MKFFSLRNIKVWLAILAITALTSCSSKHSVIFNIHTEPEGAHVVYTVDHSQWIYLGVTPLSAIEVMDEDDFQQDQTVTLKTMRCGYLEQSKEWNGESLLEENEEKGMIFWTPRLIKDAE